MTPEQMREAAAFLDADAWTLRNARAPVAAYERSDLARLLREQAESMGWRPIETAPRDGTQIILWCPGGVFIGTYPLAEVSKRDKAALVRDLGVWPDHRKWTPTHWQPLPPPPQP